jgi:hypothetical protein
MANSTTAECNRSRFRQEDTRGFYESYFQRANHPSRPLAFWIRYTVFSPKGRPQDARGELWAIYFDGEARRNTAVKETFTVSDCSFSQTQLSVQIGGAMLNGESLRGDARSTSHEIKWTLKYSGQQPPLLLLPEKMYEQSFPKAKALVGTPNAVYMGTLVVDGQQIDVDGWRGSQNHNWGSRHTDRYAWGQVAGFDNAADAFLECSTAQLKLGPLWTPRMTFVVLRDENEEIALNGLMQAVRSHGSFDFFEWTIDALGERARVYGRIQAPADAFVGLTYMNPPGGQKICLNTKLASAEFNIERPGRPRRTLATRHRAAFEILTDRDDHGVHIAL